MRANDVVRDERQALSELFAELGPDEPTLCAGWDTRDLLAHLVIREGRPDAALGLVVPQLSGHTESVQNAAAERPYDELISTFRDGPPLLSPFRLPGAESQTNFTEFLVHHEDVRRGKPGWEPRPLSREVQDIIWSRLGREAKTHLRRVRAGVLLRRTDTGDLMVAKSGEPVIELEGEPLEMLMRILGRTEVRLRVNGDPDAVAAFESSSLGI